VQLALASRQIIPSRVIAQPRQEERFMADQKDDTGQTGKFAQTKRATSSGSAPEQFAGGEDRPAVTVARRKQRYLIGVRSLPGVTPMPIDAFLERLTLLDGVEIVRRLRTRNLQSEAGPYAPLAAREVIVVQMDELRGEALRQNAPPQLIVEIDARLGYSDMAASEPLGWQLGARAMPFPRPRRDIRFQILGEGDRPLANAGVYLYGYGFPAQAITDSSGHAILQTFAADDTGVVAVYVRPAADHWERYIQNPSLEPSDVNVIRLSPLGRISAPYSGAGSRSWGQRLMKFDGISADWSGAGIKVGLIDSGCDSAHPALRHVTRGVDLTRENDSQSWKSDELGHGTHCAGIVAGSVVPSSQIAGCAPGSEVHVFKVVPGGYFSDLIDALDQCIEQRLDIVQVGVCSDQFSELVAQKIVEARLNGIACIAGAGNSGGPVQFPGNVSGVLTVSAIGKLGEFPQDTRHAQRALPQPASITGIFASNFSGWGPQVAVCAPGVAVISSVPGGGYAAWDGASMAASHVTGFAALLLSHHPALQRNQYGEKVEQRVAVLSDLIRAAAIPYIQLDPARVGAGIPDLQQVPAVQSRTIVGPYGDIHLPPPGGGPAGLPPAAHLGNSMAAIMQLRAAGMWI
jgi:subtilisin